MIDDRLTSVERPSPAGSSSQTLPAFATERCRFTSFDGGVGVNSERLRPDRYSFFQRATFAAPAIARGAGHSYAAASFGAGIISIENSAFDRVLGFDSEVGIVEVEAGITLGTMYRFLAPRGFYLPTQPGYGAISVGGCIAADVHGKNQARDGTFIEQVESLRLFHPDHGVLELAPDRERELFRLTCGGFGLTGIILSARLKAKPIPSATVEFATLPVVDALAGADMLSQTSAEADFVYSWHDFTRRGRGFGRGFVQAARFVTETAPSAPVEPALAIPRLSASARCSWRVPLLNIWTVRALNRTYEASHRVGPGVHHLTLAASLFPIHATQAYFKLFGRAGFHEYQAIVSEEHFADYIAAIRDYTARRPIAISLASAKYFRGRPELLRFTGDGICLAMNFPRDRVAADFLAFLDGLVVELSAIPNIIKDSRLPRSVVAATYPGLGHFEAMLRELDPARLFRSDLSNRLGL